ncbi:putative diguanylate cyclase AdrA [Desulfosporosinus acididurans]|uniref:Putative diguanylate cyclase AdrA n=1 Tax=Desulfosporosinus acididurans TaxID=476652 RepID=A0A0J1FN14_9FIRM|nr:diguanylate cyclase [Desulfosporosinus acididurans]KLU64732.1 putative diguanylate cyclase AdrA [Desulfosporosinus acididurans]
MVILRIMLCGFLLASGIFTLLVAIYSFRKRDPATNYFAVFSLSITFYSLGYAMELYSDTLVRMRFWNFVEYIGLPFLPALWLVFTFEYNNKHIGLIEKLCIFMIPFMTFIFRVTNSLNHFYYLSVKVTSNYYFPVLYIEKGPWYWVHALFVTSCFIVANYVYYAVYKKSIGPIRRQGAILLIASLLPWVTVVLDLLNLSPLDIDYGPFAVTSSVILFFIAFLRYHFLNIKPLARDKAFELTNDGIIVLDTNYNIIDFNPSAVVICNDLRENVIGKDVQVVLGRYKGLVYSILNEAESQCDLEDPKGNYRVNTVRILEVNHRQVGYLVTLTDITKYVNMMQELNHLASRDALTGVYNRRYFVELSSREIVKAKRYNHALSLIIIDLDYFKQINDTHGHQAGDLVLIEVVKCCRNSIRSIDIFGRFGGEEFVILFPETNLGECNIIAGRILKNIENTIVSYENKHIKITASLGVTGTNFLYNQSLDIFLKKADQALYQAKSEGRNCFRCLEL